MSNLEIIALALAGWLASSWLAYRWGLRSQSVQREHAAKSAIKQRRLEFLGFLKGWKIDFDRTYLEMGGYDRRPSSFTDVVPSFIQSAEFIRWDLKEDDRKRFDEMVSEISKYRGRDFDNGERYKHLCDSFDAFVAFIESQK